MKAERRTPGERMARARGSWRGLAAAGLSAMTRDVTYIGWRAGDEIRRRTAAQPPNAP